jgi:hypothetical protein
MDIHVVLHVMHYSLVWHSYRIGNRNGSDVIVLYTMKWRKTCRFFDSSQYYMLVLLCIDALLNHTGSRSCCAITRRFVITCWIVGRLKFHRCHWLWQSFLNLHSLCSHFTRRSFTVFISSFNWWLYQAHPIERVYTMLSGSCVVQKQEVCPLCQDHSSRPFAWNSPRVRNKSFCINAGCTANVVLALGRHLSRIWNPILDALMAVQSLRI